MTWRTRVLPMLALASLVAGAGCKRTKDEEAPQLELTEEKTDEELRNLLALCKAAIDVLQMPGVQDRLGRIAEIAAPTSATTVLLDGLQAMEGPKRMGFVKALIEKYGTQKQCEGALPAFDRGPPQPGEAALPGQPPPGQPGTAPQPAQPQQPGFPAGQPVQPGQGGQPGEPGPGGQPGQGSQPEAPPGGQTGPPGGTPPAGGLRAP